MKCVCVLLMLTALAYAAPEKRFLLDSLDGIISTDILKADIQQLLDILGGDPTEAACEAKAHEYFTSGLVQHSIPLVCHSFQELVKHFQLTPQVTTTATV